MSVEHDVVVAGAGPVALAFAASLRGTGLRVALVDPQPGSALAEPADDGREIALTDRSVALLQALGAWDRIPVGEIAPLRRMQVLNGPSRYAMHLGLDGAGRATGALLGRFASNRLLRRALFETVENQPEVTLLPGASVIAAQPGEQGTLAVLSDGRLLRAQLVVGADSRRSRLRTQQRIHAATHDYRQRMLTCPVEHERPHDATATAWFEYGRTLVTLPLLGQRSSAVMTVSEADAEALLRLDDAAFGAELTRRYRGRLGRMRPVGPRHAVPVLTAYASRFAGRRFALIGDAAVGMHPTTAHGFNFGLLGQHALASALRGAVAAGRNIADAAVLAGYEREHRNETRLFFAGAEALMRLYAAGDTLPARLLRDTALRLGNLPPVRQALEGRMRAPVGR